MTSISALPEWKRCFEFVAARCPFGAKLVLEPGAVTLSGADGDDAKHYQEKQLRRAIELVKR